MSFWLGKLTTLRKGRIRIKEKLNKQRRKGEIGKLSLERWDEGGEKGDRARGH